MSEIARQRFPSRSRESLRRQYGATREQKRGEAMDDLIRSGNPPSSYGSMRGWESAVQRRVDERDAEMGPMAYDQSQGKMIPSPKARSERLSAEMEAAEKGKAEAMEKGDRDFEKVKNTSGARSYNDNGEWAEWQARGDGSKDRNVISPDGEEMVQIQTPSGGYISARGQGAAKNYIAARFDEEERLARLAEMRAKGRAIRDRMDEERADSLASKLKERGITVTPRKEDGSFDFDRAQGMLAQATFDAWDSDKRLDQLATRMERDARRELSDLRRSKRNRFGAAGARKGEMDEPITAARMRELEDMIATGEKNRSGLRPGFWRTEAENDQRNRVAQVELARRSEERSRALIESQRKQAAAVRTRAEAVGRPLSEDEIKELGYPAWDDEAAWQERMKTDPSAVEVYNMRPVNVSRAGKAMSRALSAVV